MESAYPGEMQSRLSLWSRFESAFILSVLFTMFLPQAHSGIIFKIKNCGSLFHLKFFNQAKGLNPHFEIQDPMVARWVALVTSENEPQAFFKSGQIVNFKGNTYTVLGTLGAGFEGVAMLVRGPHGLRVLKNFYLAKTMRRSLAVQHRLYSKGILPLPQVIDFDLSRRLALIDYFEGIPMDHIFKHGENMGLSVETMQSVRSRGYQMSNGPSGLRDLIYLPSQDKVLYIEDP